MKTSIIYMRHFLILTAIAVIVAACGGQTGDKEAELNNLLKEQKELNERIAKLQIELASEGKGTQKDQKYKQVVTQTIQPDDYRHYLEIQGRVDAEDNIMLSTQTGGLVRSVTAREGQEVRKGQILAELDNQSLRQSIEEIRTQYQLTKTLYEKQKNLWDQKIGSEVQYLTARTNKLSMERRLGALNEQLEMTRIKSPINGTVDAVNIKEGSTVSPGMPAIRVVNYSNLKVVAGVPDTYASRIKKGDNVQLFFPDLNRTFETEIQFVGNVINPINRTFDVEVKVDAQDAKLNPNMVAVVKINDLSVDSALVVPINTIQNADDEKYVFIAVDKQGQFVAKRQPVKVESTYNGMALITEGIKAGDRLITVGYQSLVNDQPVKF
ncbi:MAG: efflux RND transporter periplasmic adaptor subunit [Bacteroidia bacterium]